MINLYQISEETLRIIVQFAREYRQLVGFSLSEKEKAAFAEASIILAEKEE